MRRATRATAMIAAALLIGSTAACTKSDGPEKSTAAFVSGWTSGSFDSTLQIIDANGAKLDNTTVATQIKAISGDLATIKPTVQAGKATVTKNTATVPLSVSWPIATGVKWSYQSSLRLDQKDDKWRPIWTADVLAPGVTATDKLAVRNVPAKRGTINAGSGAPLVTDTPVTYVGVQKSKIKDLAALTAALDTAFKAIHKDVDLSGLPKQVQTASPEAFIPVVTLRNSDYQKIRAQIHDLNGTVFRTGTLALAPTSSFGRAILGTVGDVTKDRMTAKPGKYVIGDQVGFGGLQEAYDDRLRGKSGISVVIPGKTGTDASGDPVQDKTLYHVDPVDGQPITSTLDVKTQNAAEQALVGETKNAAIVAIRISDGHILALANGPAAQPVDYALSAQVPPGSMFKAVTATNLLQAGKITANTTVKCTATLTVNGYTIHNAEQEQLGNVPLHTDFAKSCNTAFASLAPQLGPTGLKDTAATLGIGIPWQLGVDVFTGSVSANGDATEQAAAAFGQGKTLVSPVVMAGAAAALSRGQWKQPILTTDPPVAPVADQAALKPSTVDAMHTMMREVVTGGTGVKVLHVPGGPVYGKTGTAEFDNKPADTHSWFMGFQGDIAFAVFVDNGGMSTAAAVPIAGKFFTNLH